MTETLLRANPLAIYSPPEDDTDEDISEESGIFDFVEEDDAKPRAWSSYFLDDLKFHAKNFIRSFFTGKSWYCGGEIDISQITSDYYVELLLNTDVETGVQAVYDRWYTAATLGVVSLTEVKKAQQIGDIPSDIEAVLAVQKECNRRGIPKAFRGGITMMYFEFCEGFNFADNWMGISVGAA
jgi:hypothetical protein